VMRKRAKKEKIRRVQKAKSLDAPEGPCEEKLGTDTPCRPRCIYCLPLLLTKLRPSICAAGSIPGKIPDAPVSAGKAQWSPYRIANNWFLFPTAFASRPRHRDRHPPRVLL